MVGDFEIKSCACIFSPDIFIILMPCLRLAKGEPPSRRWLRACICTIMKYKTYPPRYFLEIDIRIRSYILRLQSL